MVQLLKNIKKQYNKLPCANQTAAASQLIAASLFAVVQAVPILAVAVPVEAQCTLLWQECNMELLY